MTSDADADAEESKDGEKSTIKTAEERKTEGL